jgi:ABC-type lipoprotein release transport system permease subunit
MANDLENEVSAGAYRVVGLFVSGSTPFDRTQVYVHLDEARRLLGMESGLSTLTIRLRDGEEAEAVAAQLVADLADESLEILTWKERNPLVEMAREAYDYSAIILAIILFTAVGFTLANSFLMVIFERIRELGILLAGGIRPRQIRRMLVREALFIAVLGSGVGVLLSALLLGYWTVNGLDLSAFSEGLGAYGIQSIIYPVFDTGHMLRGFAVILIMVFLAVQYPAWKASRFEAVEAINHD